MRYTVFTRYHVSMGQKTSIYLTDDMVKRTAATGLPPGEVYRRGLEAAEQAARRESLEAAVQQAIREELGTPMQLSVLTRAGDGTWRLAGSFDFRKAARFRSRAGREDIPPDLYRTDDNRWVLHAFAGTPAEKVRAFVYVTDDEARDWLRENGHEEAARRLPGTSG